MAQGVVLDWVAWAEVDVVEVVEEIKVAFHSVEGEIKVVVEPVVLESEWQHAVVEVVVVVVEPVVVKVAFHSVKGRHAVFKGVVVEPVWHGPAVVSEGPWHGFEAVEVVEFTFTGEFTAHDLVVFQRIVDVAVEGGWVVGADGFHFRKDCRR